MKDIILKKLEEIEKNENVKILHAVESGSRSWGFPSPDSDFDVRFFYVRPKDFYLKLEKTRDVIEWQLDETLDINGWDLQKMFRLLHKSNPTLFEWNNSDIIYKTTPQWTEISSIIDQYFISKNSLYHYLNMAGNNYRAETLKGDTVKLKKYFYVIRPILACKWILSKNTPPPMPFLELVDAELDKNLRPIIDDLLAKKALTSELEVGTKIPELNDFIENNLNILKEAILTITENKNNDWEKLNLLFLKML